MRLSLFMILLYRFLLMTIAVDYCAALRFLKIDWPIGEKHRAPNNDWRDQVGNSSMVPQQLTDRVVLYDATYYCC